MKNIGQYNQDLSVPRKKDIDSLETRIKTIVQHQVFFKVMCSYIQNYTPATIWLMSMNYVTDFTHDSSTKIYYIATKKQVKYNVFNNAYIIFNSSI